MAEPLTILPGDDPASIERASELLRGGGLVGMPTETVYGLAAHALDTDAVARVFEAKERPTFDPLIVHIATREAASELAEFDAIAQRLAQAFWPGPMTLVLPRRMDEQGQPIVPDLVTAGLDTVGLRVPDHPVAHRLLETTALPLAAPSANRFGSISPTRAEHVAIELVNKVDLILDGGPCEKGIESTVMSVIDGLVQVLRLGALPVELIEEVLGMPIEVLAASSSPGRQAKPSPGMIDRHYAPRTEMRMAASIDDLPLLSGFMTFGLIGLGQMPEVSGYKMIRSLSESGELHEAAANLFRVLREMDQAGLDHIVAVEVPDEGIGRAINDRLRRGCVR